VQMKRLVAGFTLALIATSAMATNWLLAARAETFVLYYDTDSVKRANGKVSVWMHRVFPQPRTENGVTYDGSKARVWFNCSADTYQITTRFLVLSGSSVQDIQPTQSEDVSPGSVMDGLEKIVCR
jgi:hypothetical protein